VSTFIPQNGLFINLQNMLIQCNMYTYCKLYKVTFLEVNFKEII